MKQRIFFIILWLMISIPSLASANWISFQPDDHSNTPTPAQVEVVSDNNNEMVINIDISGMTAKTVQHDGQDWQQLEIPGCGYTQEIGKARLPWLGRYIALPENAQISVEHLSSSEPVVLDNYNVYPVQPPQMESSSKSSSFEYDPDFYFSRLLYPFMPFSLEGPYIIRGLRFNILRIYPIRYIPKQRQIKAYSTIRLRITFLDAQGPYIDQRFCSESYDIIFEKMFLNLPEQFIDSGPSTRMAYESNNSLLIISHPDFLQSAQKLQSWKVEKGIETIVNTTAETGTTASKIRAFIQNAYDTWANPPTYILLMGDAEYIPTNYQTTHPYAGGKIGTDLYYATTDGDDYFPDISIGRLAVDTSTEAMKRVEDIIDYEKGLVTNESYYSNAAVCAYFQDDDQDGTADRRFAQTSEDISLFLENNPFPNYSVHRVYTTEANVNPLYWSSRWFGGGLSGKAGDPLPSRLKKPHFPWNGDRNLVSQTINNGCFFVTHRDHGSATAWGDPSYNVNDVLSLSNGKQLPIVLSINCQTGWFDNETDEDKSNNNRLCFSEAWERNSNGGAIGVIAATRVSYSGHNDRLVWGWMDAIWPNFNTHYKSTGTPFDNPMWEMGHILNYGKYYYATQYQDNIYRQISFEMFHWFGDPTLQIRTAVPKDFSVSMDQTIIAGATAINITVDQPDALICITSQNTILGKRLSNGETTGIALSRPIEQGETIKIVINKHNFRVWETQMNVQKMTTPLKADFIANKTVLDINEAVQFKDQSIGTPRSWKWDFNADGIIDSEIKDPSWAYEKAGVYSVRLTVSNDSQSQSILKEHLIHVSSLTLFVTPNTQEVPPQKGFTAFPVSIQCANKPISYGRPWSVRVKDASWLAINSITYGKDGNAVYLSYNKNFGEERTGTVEFQADGTNNSPYLAYVKQYGAVGNLQVNMISDDSIADQVKWRIENKEWKKNGEIFKDLPVGDYILSFFPVSLWTAPQVKTVHVNCDETTVVNAQYTPQGYELKVLANVEGFIQMNRSTPVRPPVSQRFAPDTEIILNAIPENCWQFLYWAPFMTTENSIIHEIKQDIVVTANFVSNCPKLCIDQTGIGTVFLDETPLLLPWCGALPSEKTFTLQAMGQSGYQFKQWSGGLNSTKSTISNQLQQDLNLTAHFEKSDLLWECDLHVLAKNQGGQYKSMATIGVSDMKRKVEAAPLPPSYSCDIGIFPRDWSDKYSLDIRALDDNIYIWIIGINPHGNTGSPEPATVTVVWNPDNLLKNGEYQIFQGKDTIGSPIISDMRLNNQLLVTGENSDYYYTIKYEQKDSLCYQLELPKSYSLISLKVNPSDCVPRHLFPDVNVVYGYEDGGYIQDDCMAPGKGYWVNMKDQQINEICGEPFRSYSIVLKEGYHLLGGVYTNQSPRTEPNDSIVVIYEYAQGEYRQVDEMKPDRGYWVYVKQDCLFILGE
jgi:PKD repeat protein